MVACGPPDLGVPEEGEGGHPQCVKLSLAEKRRFPKVDPTECLHPGSISLALLLGSVGERASSAALPRRTRQAAFAVP